MRLLELSKFEPKAVTNVITPEQVIKYIQTNCQPWLKATKGRVAYRGSNVSANNAFFIQQTRKNRMPDSTGDEEHRLFNKIIKSVGGIANRSNSVFLSGDPSTAVAYGEVYVVFPIGNFRYTWSPTWSDWFYATHEIIAAYNRNNIKKHLLIDKGLTDALKGSSRAAPEIMVACEKTLYIDVNWYHKFIKGKL